MPNGATPMHLAAQQGHVKVLRLERRIAVLCILACVFFLFFSRISILLQVPFGFSGLRE